MNLANGDQGVKIKTELTPGTDPKSPRGEYWLAWANGVQSDGWTEGEAVVNAKAALKRGDPVDPTYRA